MARNGALPKVLVWGIILFPSRMWQLSPHMMSGLWDTKPITTAHSSSIGMARSGASSKVLAQEQRTHCMEWTVCHTPTPLSLWERCITEMVKREQCCISPIMLERRLYRNPNYSNFDRKIHDEKRTPANPGEQ